MIKRSVTLKGHRTSVALEAPFWDAIDALVAKRQVPLAQLIFEIDVDRQGGLASALRLLALDEARKGQLPLKP